MQEMSQRRSCETQLTICNLFWLGPVTNEELSEEVSLQSSELSVVYGEGEVGSQTEN